MRKILCLCVLLVQSVHGFVNYRVSSTVTLPASSPLSMISPVDMLHSGIDNNVSTILNDVPSIMISETEAWVQPLATILGPFLNLFSFAMVGFPLKKSMSLHVTI